MQAVLTLAITAPPEPPGSGTAFLNRLEPGWLEAAYAGDPPRRAAAATARKHLGDIALRYRTLLDRLGPALDHGGSLADADAWYFILEGTREQSVAEAQALALTELVACAVTDRDAEPRAVLLACDDYSAVSGKVSLSTLYERGRSLGIGVQVSASPGRDWGRVRMSGTGSRPPPTAAFGSCAPPTPSPSANWPAPGASSKPRPG